MSSRLFIPCEVPDHAIDYLAISVMSFAGKRRRVYDVEINERRRRGQLCLRWKELMAIPYRATLVMPFAWKRRRVFDAGISGHLRRRHPCPRWIDLPGKTISWFGISNRRRRVQSRGTRVVSQ